MDQQLSSAAQNLENVICKGLGLNPKPGSSMLRAIKLRTLKDAVQHPFPEEDYHQAVRALQSIAPDAVAFSRQLEKLETRGTRGLKELVGLLHLLATDPGLKVLTQGPFQSDTSKPAVPPSKPTLSTLQPTGAAVAAAQVPASGTLASKLQTRTSAQPTAQPPATIPTAQQAPQPPLTSPRLSGNGATGARLSSSGVPQPAAGTTALPARTPAAGPAPAAKPVVSSSDTSSTRADVARQPLRPSVSPQISALTQLEALARGTEGTDLADTSTQGQLALPATRFPAGTSRAAPGPVVPPVPSAAATAALATSRDAALMSARGPPVPLPPRSEPRSRVPAAGDLFQVDAAAPTAPHATEVVQELLESLPAWNAQRPHLTCRDLVITAAARATQRAGSGSTQDRDPVDGLPPSAQEVAVMSDLLYTFMGVDGSHVQAVLTQGQQGKGLAYSVRPCLDASSLELVDRLTPLCEYTAILQRFTETRSSYQYGMVSHAVCAALRQLLGDWQLVVTQLEHQLRTGRLTLQGMVYYCQGPMVSLGLVAGVAAEAASKQLSSAGLLNLLADKVSSLAGDPPGRALMQRILHAAMTPYFRILERWLCEGVLDDPYGEFMIEEDKSVTHSALTASGKLAYWSQRYTVRRRQAAPSTAPAATPPTQPSTAPDVPDFLAALTDKILTTGKYLNAIRECGQPPARPLPANTHLAPAAPAAYAAAIHAAHTAASTSLLRLVLDQSDMMGWLRSLKHFYLLDQGDVVVHLSEAARDELSSPLSQVNRPRLKSLLELALRTSSLAQDAHTESLHLDLDPRPLYVAAETLAAMDNTQRRKTLASQGGVLPSHSSYVWEAVQFSVNLGWPLTLVAPPHAIRQYQLIFRHLFRMKHVERQLAAAWHRMQGARNSARTGQDALRGAYSLAQRHLFLVQEILRYCTMDILEPAWRAMEERMRRANDLDEVIASHAQFLQAALDGLLLSHPQLLTPLLQLQQGALTFSSRVQSAWDDLEAQMAAVEARQQQELAASRALQGARGSGGGGRQSGAGGAQAGRQSGVGAVRVPVPPSQSDGGASVVPVSLNLDISGLSADFSARLRELLDGLQGLYRQAMQRDVSDTSAGQSLETREEVEALLGLVQRLQLDTTETQAAAGARAPAATSTASLYKQLAAQAAAYT